MQVIYLRKTILIERVKYFFLISLITFSLAFFLIILIESLFPSEEVRISEAIEASNNKKPESIRGGDGNAREIGRFQKAIEKNKFKVKNYVKRNLKKVHNASPKT